MALSDKDLLEARAIAAQIVASLGDKYWPIFDLLDNEWTEREKRRHRLNACLKAPDSPPDAAQRKK
jgi:hypothetical protein